ncbi:MAG: iron-containing alcohol dehydrogenase [Aminobacterium sp.]|jgi:alcohol dehydrogenase|uniref:iron-containing alcohol dehydrogenase n=1 Tax=unclassified Aminobacterium TaxID=2685012 RepID=UPI001BD00EA3|nr:MULTISPECIES: iron-containing alcohol dehydrogenase [unclassified Aminobacterium]MDD2206006.1 iron-containing alcohol dehydrogenase [Aminobacterium sp.]MDD3425875.1 iron-containing alcohol dehydrogenase [Aminobacterium sp.]MDD3707183.1 iron-containing alcohol dehydrogenase [Aminobacterium sp.]MDD4227837.1 iron-containing alcohol dehydrogenase [Aminobacterium sp.]MDD4550723.1 iron-containing alcohol dehydrogenase [Aminobacterium sp.]
MWDHKISINEIREIRTKTTAYFGVGAIRKIDDIMGILSAQGIKKVLCVTGRGSYKKTGAWNYVSDAFNKHGIEHVLYDKITPNPTADAVDEATQIARDFGAQAVIAIGGGSPIDAGKSAAILLEYPQENARSLYELKFAPTKAAPVIAINLTHGTGTEVDRFAVVSIPEKEYKPAIAYDCIYPLYAIDDPALMTGLSPDQTRYVSIDAVNHVVEAATSAAASPYSILLAQETVRLVATYLPQALQHPEDLTARYFLLYASLIAGVSFDNGLLHFTHALEHPLSAVKPDLAHGLGLAMLLPAVLKQIYPAQPEVLAALFAPVVDGLKGIPAEGEKVALSVEKWLYSLGVTSKLADEGYTENDLDRLTELAMTTPSLDGLLAIAPVPASKEVIRTIYKDSMKPYSTK